MEIRALIKNAEQRVEPYYGNGTKVLVVVMVVAAFASAHLTEPASTWAGGAALASGLGAGIAWTRAVVGTCYRCGEPHRQMYRYCPACGLRDPVGAEEGTHPREEAHASESE